MAFERKDRVKDTTTTTGTGTVTLTGTAPSGYRSVSAAHTDGATVRYAISMGAEWEVGEGIYTASGTTLSRASVLASSNAGALVNFSAGTKDVITTLTANEVDGLVKGPASATANSLARFDGTTGKLLKDGAVIGTDVQAYWKPAAIQDFRLTLTTGVPVTTSDVTAAGTIYCTPYKGNAIALYDGTNWNVRTSAEFSLALSGLTSGKPYDIFCYDNSGTPTLEFLVWTNDTTRATSLAYQDGVLVKSGAATRRYMGTFYTTGTTTTEDSVSNRYLWNYYHRQPRSLLKTDATGSWTYSTATWRQANNSSSNQVNVVSGVAESPIVIKTQCLFYNSAAAPGGSVGVGIDVTNANSAQIFGGVADASGQVVLSEYRGIPTAGKHYFAWLEYVQATGTTTWLCAQAYCQAGLTGEVLA